MTLLQIIEKIEKDYDLQDEQFIEREELLGYINEAIREAEAEIHKLNLEAQYFLASTDLTLVQGSGEIDLPADIYATKIRAIQYDTNDRQYEIFRFTGPKAFEEFQWLRRYGTGTSYYKYLLTNNQADGPKIQLAPVAQESGVCGTIWYIRNALELSDDTDVCDIPEFVSFVIQFAKDKCANKERGMPDAPPSAALTQQRQLMIDTLTEQVPDGMSGVIAKDLSHYEDSV